MSSIFQKGWGVNKYLYRMDDREVLYCYVLGIEHKINKTNTYLERGIKLYITVNS